MRFWCLAVLASAGFEGKVKAIQPRSVRTMFPTWASATACRRPWSSLRATCAASRGPTARKSTRRAPHPVIGLITEWLDRSGQVETRSEESDMGGTMRLGEQRCRLQDGFAGAQDSTVRDIITERHRHRYEFNNHYREVLKSERHVGFPVSPWTKPWWKSSNCRTIPGSSVASSTRSSRLRRVTGIPCSPGSSRRHWQAPAGRDSRRRRQPVNLCGFEGRDRPAAFS